jgi:hypothetical protein
MIHSSEPQTGDLWKTARKHPRVSITIPVEVRVGKAKTITNTLNLSVGGMLLQPQNEPPALGTEVRLLFNLPTGYSVAASAKVVHLTTSAKVVHLMGSAIGLQFTDIDEDSRMVLSRFLRRMIVYIRRGVRVTRRMHVTVRGIASPESAIEMAETIVISRHGGLLSTRARFEADDEIFLWWPDGKRGTNARVVHRRATGAAGLMEIGFEFLQDFNFWGLDFPEESRS